LNILFTSRISSAALCPASCTNFPGFAQTNALAPQFYYWADSNIPDYQSRKRGRPFRLVPIVIDPGLRLGETDADGDEATGA
jgi:hypothetical protein